MLHADPNWSTPTRAILREAADKWTRVSTRHRMSVEFDMDPSDGNQRVLVTWVMAESSLVTALDSQFAPNTPLAANIRTGRGTTLVVFILDRIEPSHFESLATHEFGHLLGLPDSPTEGAVMSGMETSGTPVPRDLTPTDIVLCKAFGVCK